ncbi:extracellular solute-binding protein [Azospirillum sp. TSA6c]|uniref:extracellular solute-binding protein n=1 Tax=unclassified Azospirillum TaxID=2630922 RepID=UPI000D61F392|nr:extracellular solute-binding protein [Azospirillum sp. TSA6c]PWC47379.1 ABC transporter substrate-binding protein [Azospirillum sp. TSA6c]
MLDRRSFVLAAGAGLCTAGFASSSLGQQGAGKVVLYTSNNTEVVQSALDVIRTRIPNLRVEQVTGGTGMLMKRIEAEATSPAGDVFWSGGFGTLGAYVRHFESYRSPEIAAIPQNLQGPGGLWTGTNVHVMLIMANKGRAAGASLPKSWTDLFDPRWKGKVAMTDPNNSSFTYITVYALLQRFGVDGLRKLAANLVITGTTGQTNKGVSDGEYALGITSEAAAYEYVAAEQPGISLIYPAEGAVLSPEGVVLIKGARSPDAARRLYDAFLSKEVQEAVLETTYRRPSRMDIRVSSIVKLPDMADIALLDVDQSAASQGREEMLKVWNTIVADARR